MKILWLTETMFQLMNNDTFLCKWLCIAIETWIVVFLTIDTQKYQLDWARLMELYSSTSVFFSDAICHKVYYHFSFCSSSSILLFLTLQFFQNTLFHLTTCDLCPCRSHAYFWEGSFKRLQLYQLDGNQMSLHWIES